MILKGRDYLWQVMTEFRALNPKPLDPKLQGRLLWFSTTGSQKKEYRVYGLGFRIFNYNRAFG